MQFQNSEGSKVIEEKKRVSDDLARRVTLRNDKLEISLWVIVAFFIFIPSYVKFFRTNLDDTTVFFTNGGYTQFLLSILILIFPILYKLIFGILPLETLRNTVKRRKLMLPQVHADSSADYKKETIEKSSIKRSLDVDSDSNPEVIQARDTTLESETQNNYEEVVLKYAKVESLDILSQHAKEAGMNANKIFLRSGVYLLIGCLIAFGGIAVFFGLGQFSSLKANDLSTVIIELLPRFGSLFFIEFIALFFLKQSRIMMEEYRYYERIKRKRQDNFSILQIVYENKDNPDLTNLIIDNFKFEDSPAILTETQTTEVLQAQKLLLQELSPIDKMLEFAKIIKKSE